MKYYSTKAIENFKYYNDKGYGIYFLPNGGGYSNNLITEYRSSFVDIDIKDEIEFEIVKVGFTGDQKELDEKVKEKFSKLNESDIQFYKNIFYKRISKVRNEGLIVPSAIIETKNGYHVYYFFKKDTIMSEVDFKKIENLLIYCYNGDTAVKNPARLMRVPDTLHMKNPDSPYQIKLIELNNEIRYDPLVLVNAFNTLKELSKDKSILFSNKDKNDENYQTKLMPKQNGLPVRKVIDYSTFNNGNVALISKGFDGLEELKEKLGLNFDSDICYIDRDDIRQYLKQQDLRYLLGISEEYSCCLFHNDVNPNATIYEFENKFFYKCHSSKCGVHHDVIEIVERLTRLPIHKSFDYLKELYNIAEVKTEWQNEQERLIEINLDLIPRFKYDLDLRNKYKYLTKFFMSKGTMGLLIQIHEVARRKLPQLAKMKNINNAVVFAPMSMVVNEILSDKKSGIDNIDNANTKTVMMIFMYVLNCVGLEQLPDEIQKKVLEFKKKGYEDNGKLVHYKHNPRFYEIVSLDTDRLVLAEEMAEFFYTQNLTMKSFNREQILRLMGEDEANRVFPDRKDEKIPEMNELISKELESVTLRLININGWTNDAAIMNEVRIPKFNMKQEFINTLKYIKNKKTELDDIVIKDDEKDMIKWYGNFLFKKLRIYMPIIADKCVLTKSRLDKKVRSKFNIGDDVHGSIYYIEDKVVSVDVQLSKLDRIKLIRLESPELSVSMIASTIGCSKQYVSDVLKGKKDKD